MKVSDTTLKFIRDLITGYRGLSPYKSGPLLVDFFNKFGFEDIYGQGFPSRWYYTEERLKILNEQNRMDEVLITYLHPVNWIDNEKQLNEIVDKLNKYLDYEGYEIIIKGKGIKIIDRKASILKTSLEKELTHEGIQETLSKCELRIKEGDYAGAITASRTLLETILLYIYQQSKGMEYKFDGNLPKLFKEVLKILNLTVTYNTPDSVKQIISGLISTVNGVSGLSNTLGDRHGKLKDTMFPKEYAILVFNATKTVAEFLFAITCSNLNWSKKES